MIAQLTFPASAAANPRKATDEAAEAFEAMAMAELLAPMFKALEVEGFGGGFAEEMFRPMLVQSFAKSMAGAGGVGIGDMLKTELLRLQGLSPETTP
jgi:flagellar protein FlgJ